MTATSKNTAGFSLIELIIAAAIFGSVLAFVGGAFSLFVGKQRAQLNQQLLQQEIQNLFDTMEREVKTAYGNTFNEYFAPATSVTFMNQEQKYNDPQVETVYSLDSSNGYGQVISNDSTRNIPLTSKNIDVKSLNFIWSQSGKSTTAEPYLTGPAARLTVAVKACVRGDDNSCVIVQDTMASQQTKPLTNPQ